MMPATEFVGLFLAAMAGGSINAVAGGGTRRVFRAKLSGIRGVEARAGQRRCRRFSPLREIPSTQAELASVSCAGSDVT